MRRRRFASTAAQAAGRWVRGGSPNESRTASRPRSPAPSGLPGGRIEAVVRGIRVPAVRVFSRPLLELPERAADGGADEVGASPRSARRHLLELCRDVVLEL